MPKEAERTIRSTFKNPPTSPEQAMLWLKNLKEDLEYERQRLNKENILHGVDYGRLRLVFELLGQECPR
jgi:hypothetical protein